MAHLIKALRGGVRSLRIAALSLLVALPAAAAELPADFLQALELIHAYNGPGDELVRAEQLAARLAAQYPQSGYAETLHAEAASTWALSPRGEPEQLRQQIVDLANEALRMNPALAHAHVAKARAYVRASMIPHGGGALDAALALDPQLAGAMFLYGEIYARLGEFERAEGWYRKFIAASPAEARKANGHAAIASMYSEGLYRGAGDQEAAFISKARAAYEASVALVPKGAWHIVNYASFLNEFTEEYELAESWALKALGLMEFRMARYHLAAARYQRLLKQSSVLAPAELARAVQEVADATRVPLETAMVSRAIASTVRGRLQRLHELRAGGA